jgi:U3 small nucleolar RNA-associated protein 21
MAHSGGSATTGGGPLFKPFRALGYITEDVPFVVQRRGKETYMTVSVGRTWQVRQPACSTCTAVPPDHCLL